MISAILSPLIFAAVGIVCLVIFFSLVGKPGSKPIEYDEETFQNYALEKYAEVYGDSEDDILYIFLASQKPESDGYYDIAVYGKYVQSDITYRFKEEGASFQRKIKDGMTTAYDSYYLNRMDTSFCDAVEAEGQEIKTLGGEAFRTGHPTEPRSKPLFINKTSYVTNMDEELVQTALDEFYADTGVVLGIYVDDMDKVFKRSNFMWILLVVGIVFVAIAVFLVFGAVKAVKAYKARKNGGSSNRSNGSNGSDGSNGLDNDIFRSSRHTDEGGYY